MWWGRLRYASSLSERSLSTSFIVCGRAKTRLQRVSWPQNGLQAHDPSEKHVLSDKLLEGT